MVNKKEEKEMDTRLTSININLTKTGEVKKVGWKTFEGMVYQLKLINKRYLRNRWSGDFTIRLPIKFTKELRESQQMREG